jgi:PKD repeat protein
MKTSLIIPTCGCMLLLCGCQKEPKAAFSTDKEVYRKGETMQMINSSENAFTYKWTLSNSISEFDSKEPQIPAKDAGLCEITLTAFSRNGGRTNKATKTVTIEPGEGELTFYASSEAATTYTVQLIDRVFGSPTLTYAAAPECKAAGTVTVVLPEGTHVFTIRKDPQTEVSQSAVVDAGVCKKVKL